MIVEIQVLPHPPGTDDSRWAHVDAAIAVVAASGLAYEVGPLGTSIEGEPDAVWALVRRVHESTLCSGASSVVSVVKAQQDREPDRQPSMAALVDGHRRETR